MFSMLEFGTTNSLAPPKVWPFPTNPGKLRNTGEAIPIAGVSNSITANGPCNKAPESSIKVNLFAKAFEFEYPNMSSAAVTKTSSAPGAPIVGDFK